MLLILFKAKTEYFLMHFLILTILLVLTLFCQANLFSAIHSLYLHVCKYMSCYPSVQNWGTQSSHAQTPFSICSYLSHHRAIVVRQDCKAHYYLPINMCPFYFISGWGVLFFFSFFFFFQAVYLLKFNSD